MVIIREFKNLFESLAKMFVQNICLFEMFLQDICWKRLFETCLLKNLKKVWNRFFWLEFSDVQIWAPSIKMFVQDLCSSLFFWAIWFRLLFKTLVLGIRWRLLSKKSLEWDPFQRHPEWVKVLKKCLEQTSQTNVWTNILNKHF